jgi:hypothetical protein
MSRFDPGIHPIVITGLDPVIHVLLNLSATKNVDGRVFARP